MTPDDRPDDSIHPVDQGSDAAHVAPEAAAGIDESRAGRSELARDLRRHTLNTILLLVIGVGVAVSAVLSFSARGAASDADRSAAAAVVAADAAAELARDTVESNQAAACRSQFSAQVTDARTARETASTVLLVALSDAAFVALSDGSSGDINAGEFAAARSEVDDATPAFVDANTVFQRLIVAEASDPDEFERLCDIGSAAATAEYLDGDWDD